MINTIVTIIAKASLYCALGNTQIPVQTVTECNQLKHTGSYGIKETVNKQIDKIILETKKPNA